MTIHSEFVAALQTGDTRAPLFCFPSPNLFRDMTKYMTSNRSVFGVDVIKLYESHPTYTIAQIARLCIEIMRQYQSCGPYYLCGWSFGGFVAFEMAAQLASTGEVGLLVVLDVENPAATKDMQFRLTYFGDRVRKYARNAIRGDFSKLAQDVVKFITPKPDKITWFLVEPLFRILKRPVPSSFQINTSIVDAACQDFKPSFYTGRLVLIRTHSRGQEFSLDPSMGWKKCVDGPIDIHFVPGEHVSILEPPNIQAVLEKLMPYLTQDENTSSLMSQKSP